MSTDSQTNESIRQLDAALRRLELREGSRCPTDLHMLATPDDTGEGFCAKCFRWVRGTTAEAYLAKREPKPKARKAKPTPIGFKKTYADADDACTCLVGGKPCGSTHRRIETGLCVKLKSHDVQLVFDEIEESEVETAPASVVKRKRKCEARGCGRSFTPARSTSRFCSSGCRNRQVYWQRTYGGETALPDSTHSPWRSVATPRK